MAICRRPKSSCASAACRPPQRSPRRVTRQGVIASYIHPGSQLGVLVEVNCESDFVARTDDFTELVKDIAMQVAAADPQFIRREDVTKEALEKEMDVQRGRAKQEGKPEKMVEKIVEGRMNKYYEEVCLYEQPFIKENTTTVADLIKVKIAKLGENISVSRFVRFKVGEAVQIEETAETAPPANSNGLNGEISAHCPQAQRRSPGGRGFFRYQ